MKTDPGTIQIANRHMNVEIGAEAALIPEKNTYMEFSLQCTAHHRHFWIKKNLFCPSEKHEIKALKR